MRSLNFCFHLSLIKIRWFLSLNIGYICHTVFGFWYILVYLVWELRPPEDQWWGPEPDPVSLPWRHIFLGLLCPRAFGHYCTLYKVGRYLNIYAVQFGTEKFLLCSNILDFLELSISILWCCYTMTLKLHFCRLLLRHLKMNVPMNETPENNNNHKKVIKLLNVIVFNRFFLELTFSNT